MKSTKPWKTPTPPPEDHSSSGEGPLNPNRAIVLRPRLANSAEERDSALRLEEACGLAAALDLEIAHAEIAALRQYTPGTYFGSGRVTALSALCKEKDAGIVIIDAAVSPVQQRNLEKALNAKVVDRTGLILEIFGRRAQTREGRLQVELARLGYERSRLVRTWTHLERQRGGTGKTGGPGEAQIELDRRQIADRIVRLKKDLEEVRRTRGLQRRARARAGLPAIVLVGYTNAGKSTLFNRLTRAAVLAKDMPFATLDPTARLVKLPGGREAILSDTVGFITDLPTELVAAFRATLEAVMEADLLIHVRDVASPETEAQKADVLGVLDQLAKDDPERKRPPMIEAWNKIDLLGVDARVELLGRAANGRHNGSSREEGALPPLPVSAVTGEGIDALLAAIDQSAFGATRIVTFSLDPGDGKMRARIAAAGRILDEHIDYDDERLKITVELGLADAARLSLEANA